MNFELFSINNDEWKWLCHLWYLSSSQVIRKFSDLHGAYTVSIYCGTIAFSMQYSHLFTIFFCWAYPPYHCDVCVLLQKQNKNSCNCQSFYHFFYVRLSWETMRFFLNESKDISIGWVMNYSKKEGKKNNGKKCVWASIDTHS